MQGLVQRPCTATAVQHWDYSLVGQERAWVCADSIFLESSFYSTGTGLRRRRVTASRQGGMGQKSSKAPQVEARYLAPQKLYCYSEVDLRKLRKLIKDRKLAPCFPGVDSESREVVILFRYACRLEECDQLLQQDFFCSWRTVPSAF
jgi:hypothetical protein